MQNAQLCNVCIDPPNRIIRMHALTRRGWKCQDIASKCHAMETKHSTSTVLWSRGSRFFLSGLSFLIFIQPSWCIICCPLRSILFITVVTTGCWHSREGVHLSYSHLKILFWWKWLRSDTESPEDTLFPAGKLCFEVRRLSYRDTGSDSLIDAVFVASLEWARALTVTLLKPMRWLWRKSTTSCASSSSLVTSKVTMASAKA